MLWLIIYGAEVVYETAINTVNEMLLSPSVRSEIAILHKGG